MSNELMDDLAAAWQESEEAAQEEAPQQEEAPATVESGPDVGEVIEDVTPTETALNEQKETEEAPPAEEAVQEPVAEAPEPPAWAGATTREYWADVPEAVREEWLEREKAHSAELQKNAEHANIARSMMQAIAPFQPALQMEGNSPQEVFHNLGATVNGLRNGTQQEKATIIANLITNYGIEVPVLDNVLTAQYEGNVATPQQSQQEFRDPRVDQMLAQQEQQQRQQQSQQSVDANREIQEFERNGAEFLQDVRMEMADIMDMATSRGQEMSLQEAYDRACWMNPKVRGILNDREAKARAQQDAAASSITGSPSAAAPSQPETLRGALEQAFAES